VTRVANAAEEAVVITPSVHQKCERCWHYRADVGAHPEHPGICARCVANLFGGGEARRFA
jgi:isoleucyl-tRNA synthetase